MPRKSLSDILLDSDHDRLQKSWATTKAADDQSPIPAGEYKAHVVNGELFSAKSGTPGYKVTLEVIGGDYAGRRVWHDVWLSEAALPMAKRDLKKLGVEQPSQLERPLPDGIVVAVKVALRRNDDGGEFNRVLRFDVVAFEPPAPEPFAPTDEPESSDGDDFD